MKSARFLADVLPYATGEIAGIDDATFARLQKKGLVEAYVPPEAPQPQGAEAPPASADTGGTGAPEAAEAPRQPRAAGRQRQGGGT